jgi:Flp pilus assembly protein TadG
MQPSENQRGHALSLVVVVLTVLMVISVGLVQLGARAADQSRARNAADAAALAAAAGGIDAGRRLTVANHATVVSIVSDGVIVRVTVRVGAMTATAAATLVPA